MSDSPEFSSPNVIRRAPNPYPANNTPTGARGAHVTSESRGQSVSVASTRAVRRTTACMTAQGRAPLPTPVRTTARISAVSDDLHDGFETSLRLERLRAHLDASHDDMQEFMDGTNDNGWERVEGRLRRS